MYVTDVVCGWKAIGFDDFNGWWIKPKRFEEREACKIGNIRRFDTAKKIASHLTHIRARRCEVNTQWKQFIHIIILPTRRLSPDNHESDKKNSQFPLFNTSMPTEISVRSNVFWALNLNVVALEMQSTGFFPDINGGSGDDDDDSDKNAQQKMSKLLIEMSSSSFADTNLCDAIRSESSLLWFFRDRERFNANKKTVLYFVAGSHFFFGHHQR